MVRTRLREDQASDVDFLSEQEGSERFIAKEGYGTNYNVILDGYVGLVTLGAHPATPSVGNIIVYNKDDLLTILTSSGVPQNVEAAQSSTFSPVIKLGSTTLATSYALGYYSKIGKATTVTISIAFTKSGTGALTIENLPFASRNTSNLKQALVISRYEGIVVGTVYGRVTTIQAILDPNQTIIKLQRVTGDANTNIDDTMVSSTGTIEITGTYITN